MQIYLYHKNKKILSKHLPSIYDESKPLETFKFS